MALSDDKALEVLYDHYKDSFAQIQRYIQSRNRLLLYVFLGTAGMQLISGGNTQYLWPSTGNQIRWGFTSIDGQVCCDFPMDSHSLWHNSIFPDDSHN